MALRLAETPATGLGGTDGGAGSRASRGTLQRALHGVLDVTWGSDAHQMAAAFLLWDAWCRELYGRALDEGAWAEQYRAKVATGGFIQVIAWEGGSPAGMYEGHVYYDPMKRQREVIGDKAYLLPRYRGGGAWRKMLAAGHEVARWLGCAEIVAPAGVGQQADFLAGMYERAGYRKTGILYRLEVGK